MQSFGKSINVISKTTFTQREERDKSVQKYLIDL